MDELLDRLVAAAGVDRSTAEKTVGIILAFLLKEGPPDKVQALIHEIPGADPALLTGQSGGSGMGGLMGVSTELMAAGLGTEQMQAAAREIIAFAKEKIGEEAATEIVGSIPGLGQFV